MKEKLRKYDKTDQSPTVRQRKAAFKAWKTMRRDSREKTVQSTSKIDRYLTLQQVGQIEHPDSVEASRGVMSSDIISYSKGIVSLFHKTPPDIACGRFWELRWAYGCPLDCNYCYLRGTMKGNMKPSPLKPLHVLNAIDEAFQKIKEPSIFNTGELSDSLMYPSLMELIVDKFEQQDLHKVALLSKMGIRNVDFLLKKLRRQTICAWSINAPQVAAKWEKAAAPPAERINAARMVSEAGYDTRVRIDPIFPIENWRKHYEELLYQLLSEFEPNRIILGTPRGLWKTIKYARDAKIDMSWSSFFKEDSSWGKKLDYRLRKEMYQFMFDKLDTLGYQKSRVTMCKETVGMWNELNKTYRPLTCNCYGNGAY